MQQQSFSFSPAEVRDDGENFGAFFFSENYY